MGIDLIYCAGNNRILSDIARQHGWLLGVRSDAFLHLEFDAAFLDINYKKANYTKVLTAIKAGDHTKARKLKDKADRAFELHVNAVARRRPKYANAPDLSEEEFDEKDVFRAMYQYNILGEYCSQPLITPKLPEQLAMIPKTYAVAYSIPSSYGGAKYPPEMLSGYKVHLLGGSPHKQMEIYQSLLGKAQIISADGNMAQKMAISFAKYWKNKKWVRLKYSKDPKYRYCFSASYYNIYKAWQGVVSRSSAEINPQVFSLVV